MAAFRFKKNQKTYTVKAFSSLIQLAQRGMIDGDDLIFVPQIDRWVPAKALKELRPHLPDADNGHVPRPQAHPSTPPQPSPKPTPEGRPSTGPGLESGDSWLDNITPITFDPPEALDGPSQGGLRASDSEESLRDEALELPIAYVEAVSEEEVQARREKYQAGMRELVGSRKDKPRATAHEPSPGARNDGASLKEPPPGLVGLPMAEIGGLQKGRGRAPSSSKGPTSTPKLDLSFEPPQRGHFSPSGQFSPDQAFSSGGGITVEEVPDGLRLGRIGVLLLLPLIAMGLYYWQVSVVASQDFPDAPPGKILSPNAPKPGAVGPKVAEADSSKSDKHELALREKVPLKLRRPVSDIEEVQDDIFAELLNGGAYPKRVRVEPVAGELPPHAALRKVEVVTRVAFGHTEGMTREDQLALGALVIGKYIRAGELRVAEVNLVVEDAAGGAIDSYTLSAAQTRDFYSRQVRLDEFLEWLEAGSL